MASIWKIKTRVPKIVNFPGILRSIMRPVSTEVLNNPWKSVLNAGSRLQFRSDEMQNFFAQQKRDSNFLQFFNDRFPFVMNMMTKSLGLNHPVQPFTRSFLGIGSQMNSLNYLFVPVSVLFASKLFQHPQKDEKTVENLQINLSKATFMLYLSQSIHKTIKDTEDNNSSVFENVKEIHNGNKIATLVGDLFITEMFRFLAQLKNNQVVEIMTDTLAEFACENFYSLTTDFNKLPVENGPLDKKSQFLIPSENALKILLANSFKCVFILSDHFQKESTSRENQCGKNAHLLGHLLGSLYYTHLQIHSVLNSLNLYQIKPSGGKVENHIKSLTSSRDILYARIMELLTQFQSAPPENVKEFKCLVDFLMETPR